MFTTDPRGMLVLADERLGRLRNETAAERQWRTPTLRRALAASLRRAANCLDPTPLTARPA